MLPEQKPMEKILFALLDAAKKQDWEVIDTQLIPDLAWCNPNETAKALLSHVHDPDSNVRDVVSSALAALTVIDTHLKKDIVRAMIAMATQDPEVFPAGRSVTVLLKYQDDEELGSDIREALNVFKMRAEKNGWIDDLKVNIPQLAILYVN